MGIRVRLPLLLALLGVLLLTTVWLMEVGSRAMEMEDLEREAFQFVNGEAPTTAELIRLCDQYPLTDAGVRLVTQAAICLGLSSHATEFKRIRPNQFEDALRVALGADEFAFGDAAEIKLKAAKQSLLLQSP